MPATRRIARSAPAWALTSLLGTASDRTAHTGKAPGVIGAAQPHRQREVAAEPSAETFSSVSSSQESDLCTVDVYASRCFLNSSAHL